MIDSHAHLFMSEFDADRPEVISRAVEAGVERIICAGVDASSSQEVVLLAGSYETILASVGIHPENACQVGEKDLELIARMAIGSRVVAIGEIGLDYYRDFAPPELQRNLFEAQLELAQQLKLPVVIHCRRAEEDLLDILSNWQGKVSGVIHCFSSDIELAWRYFDLGFCISLGAYVGYPSSNSLRENIVKLPLDRILLETDSPYLPPQSYRGQRNEPAYLIEVAGVVARCYNIPIEKIAEETSRNAALVFGLKSKGRGAQVI